MNGIKNSSIENQRPGADVYRFKEVTQTPKEGGYRAEVQRYFQETPGTEYEKLCNFSKFVPRAVLTRYLSRTELFKRVLDVQGDVVECGVLFGGSLMTWARASSIFEPLNSQRRIIGFDTFSGFPSLSDHDKTGVAAESSVGGFGFGDTDAQADIEECVRLYDQDRQLGHIPKVQLVRGDICKRYRAISKTTRTPWFPFCTSMWMSMSPHARLCTTSFHACPKVPSLSSMSSTPSSGPVKASLCSTSSGCETCVSSALAGTPTSPMLSFKGVVASFLRAWHPHPLRGNESRGIHPNSSPHYLVAHTGRPEPTQIDVGQWPVHVFSNKPVIVQSTWHKPRPPPR